MAYPNINGDAYFLKLKTKDDQFKELQYKTEKYDHINILKSFINDNEDYKKI